MKASTSILLALKLRRKNDNSLFRMSQEFPSIKVLGTQSCPILCNPMDSRPSGSSVHEILQARILEYIAIPFSRESSCAGDQTWEYPLENRMATDTPVFLPGEFHGQRSLTVYSLWKCKELNMTE